MVASGLLSNLCSLFYIELFFFIILVCGGAAGVLIVKIDEHATRVGVRLDRLQLVVFLSGN